jgi:hypothetical protein
LICGEQEKRRLLAVALGLGATLLWNGLVRKDEPSPSQPSHAEAGAGSDGDVDVDGDADGDADADADADADVGSDVEVGSDAYWAAQAQYALASADRYESEGEYLECERVLAPESWSLSRLSDDLGEAVRLKLERCTEAADKRYAAIKASRCPLKISDAIASTAAPRAMLPRGAGAACLALVPGMHPRSRSPDDSVLRDVVCPRVALVWRVGAKLERRQLALDGGALDDDDLCCNLESIEAGVDSGQTLVRVAGAGHPCHGGTAYEATNVIYAWTGKALASPLDLSVGFH